ncbi:hypothetical protein CN326_02515 [Bacillus sp. AFS018417]|uniref:DUF805 domain-containing protein n=1 Tax=Bacillus sp. AFS018417 TaxID=2033491 RepID=UPI000BF9BF34|nr:DUF805 domain-containing protein [Bacillus sp. AFS018417]PEZ09229.1 hypothetical protein CN326_02515 [Bacillus sp. AFS018417]
MQWYLQAFKNYAGFQGRARRKEYWMFFLFNFIITIVLEILSAMSIVFLIPFLLYAIAIILPSLAVGARRLHDTGRSGWWQLLSLIPFVGGIVLIVFFCQDSEEYDNEYGPYPKFKTN